MRSAGFSGRCRPESYGAAGWGEDESAVKSEHPVAQSAPRRSMLIQPLRGMDIVQAKRRPTVGASTRVGVSGNQIPRSSPRSIAALTSRPAVTSTPNVIGRVSRRDAFTAADYGGGGWPVSRACSRSSWRHRRVRADNTKSLYVRRPSRAIAARMRRSSVSGTRIVC